MGTVTTTDPRMGAFDAVMWGVEGDPLLRSVITLVCVLDTAPDEGIILDRVERMSRTNPKLRQRAIGNPISLVAPRWETDPNFDMAYHVRWEKLPRRGAGLADVLELAERVSEQDFDRSRPLWELHIITGLAGKQAAFIIKLHHSITDGVGGLQMAASLFELERDTVTDLGPMPEAPAGSVLDMMQRIRQGVSIESAATLADVSGSAKSAANVLRKAVTDPMTTAFAAQEWTASAARMLAPASVPLSGLWTQRSLSVAFSIIEIPLADLKRASKAAGVTLNDAFMAAVTGGLYLYHEAHGSPPDALRVNMPINMRTPEGANEGGNKWVPARIVLPINVTDAASRMRQLHPILQQARTEPALGLSDVVYRLLTLLPRPVTTSIAGGLMKGTDFAATNVPGPPIPVYFAKSKVLAMIPFAPKGGAAVNVALMSYDGKVFLGVNIDRGAVNEPEQLTDLITQSLESVLAVGVPEESASATTATP